VVTSDSTEEQQHLLYREFLNMETPPGTSDFQGEGALYYFPMPTFMSHGYFSYTAERDYFDYLEAHAQFPSDSPFNQRIHETECNRLPKSFSFWEEDGFTGEINKEGKVCFEGTVFPFIHFIVYDPVSGQTHHFVEGMRE
jgi:hypothetical protein